MVQLQSHGGLTEPGDLQRVRERQQQPGDDQALQARIVQLEGQVQHEGDIYSCCVLTKYLQSLTPRVLLPR